MRSVQFSALVALVLCVGCADASIRKVPKRSDYPEWTVEQQRQVDSMKGLRFYRSRPYVVVHKPFPLASEVMLIDARVDPTGKYTQIMPGCSKELSGKLKHWGITDDRNRVCDRAVIKRKSGASPTAPAANPANAAAPTDDPNNPDPYPEDANPPPTGTPGTVISPGALDKIQPHDKAEDRPTGTATVRLSTDVDATPEHRLRDYFDLVYLPDFEEEYVVDPRANLGDVNVHLTQGPGGVLMAMGMQIDNSAITRPLVDAYSELIKQGTEIAKSALGKAAGLPSKSAAPPNFAPDAEVVAAPGTSVTLRVHVVKMAAPGLYPILKDSELLDSRDCLRRLGYCNDGKCPTGICDPSDRIVVPVPPYTRIAYQYFTTVVVEELFDPPPTVRGFAVPPLGEPAAPSAPPAAPAAPAAPEAAGSVDNDTICRLLTFHLGEAMRAICGPALEVSAIEVRSPVVGAVASIEELTVVIRGAGGQSLTGNDALAAARDAQRELWRLRQAMGMSGLRRLDVHP